MNGTKSSVHQRLKVKAKSEATSIQKKIPITGPAERTDTTDRPPIPLEPCTKYEWFLPSEGDGKPKIRTIQSRYIESLHALTCQWATMTQELSLDSTQLPKYARPTGDTLQLEDGPMAYAVEMVQLRKEPTSTPHELYFVAEVGDSLYYKEVEKAAPHHGGPFSSHLRVRSLRPLDVPKAESQYIWFEYARFGEKEQTGDLVTWEHWKAHIFTYDRHRGFRHLQWVPIRREERTNGELIGAKQWDASMPEAGYMRVEKRLEKGKDLTLEPPEHWLGLHVIDSTAAGTGSVRPSCD